MTESYDFLRVLYAHLGKAYSPETGEPITAVSKEYVLNHLLQLPADERIQILSPLTLKKNESFEQGLQRLQAQGYLRIRLNKETFELDETIPFDKHQKNELFLVIDRLVINDTVEKRLLEAIEQATNLSNGTLVVAQDSQDTFFNLGAVDVSTGKSYPPITPHTFSFNTSQGMCPDCLGLGFQYGADLASSKEIMQMTPLSLMYLLWKRYASKEGIHLCVKLLKKCGIDPKEPLNSLSSSQLQLFLNGSETSVEHEGMQLQWSGLNNLFALLAKGAKHSTKELLIPLLEQATCSSCKGTRLNALARHVRIKDLSIADLCALPITQAFEFLQEIQLHKKEQFLKETQLQLLNRLHFLKAIGLGYLSLDRSAPTLSGGETQRTKLARQLGSGLTGCLYVLDEPTIGLHPYNNELLNKALKTLADLGNTLLLVEHDPMTVQLADYILDFGPHAGKEGGRITASGTLKEILKNPHSLTGAYLSGKKSIPIPKTRRKAKGQITIKNAALHNLKKITVSLPLHTLTCVTGVSGSGKSSLISDLLRGAITQALAQKNKSAEISYCNAKISGIDQVDQLLVLDQSPIGHTNRADVSTYVDLLTPLRTLFASLPEAKVRGLQPKNFSFNHRKGMCTTCQGLGFRTIQMQFLPPVKVTCETCHGYRLNPLSLQVRFKGKHLGEILNMSVAQAKEWITLPKVLRILETLTAVGLGYVLLSQEIATLSGGEAQRLRLSRELKKRAKGNTFYLFDEPTVGLHQEDIAKLLPIFHELVNKGNTVVIIEHQLDVIANADYIIDLGPGAGSDGGQIVAKGTPEEIARHPTSHTGHYLKSLLS